MSDQDDAFQRAFDRALKLGLAEVKRKQAIALAELQR